MGTVFIVQEPIRKDQDGEWEHWIDFSPASAYGKLEVLLPPQSEMVVGLNPGPMVTILKGKLKDFCELDYIVPAGDPVASCAAAMVAAFNNRGRVKVLRWDNKTRQYVAVDIRI